MSPGKKKRTQQAAKQKRNVKRSENRRAGPAELNCQLQRDQKVKNMCPVENTGNILNKLVEQARYEEFEIYSRCQR